MFFLINKVFKIFRVRNGNYNVFFLKDTKFQQCSLIYDIIFINHKIYFKSLSTMIRFYRNILNLGILFLAPYVNYNNNNKKKAYLV